MQILDLAGDFIRAWDRSPTWESIRDDYVTPHLPFLTLFHTNWVNGAPSSPDVVLNDYLEFWGARPAYTASTVARLRGVTLEPKILEACRAPVEVLRPRQEITVTAFAGLETTSAAQMLIDGRPYIALPVEAWREEFLGLPMDWAALPVILAHEIAHVVRYTESDCGLARQFATAGFDYGAALQAQPLLEFLVDEGLGTYLSGQLVPQAGLEEILVFQPDHLRWCFAHEEELWTEARATLQMPPGFPGYRRYFSIGAGGRPPRTGYFLGWRLVSEFAKRHPDLTPADLARLPAEAFSSYIG